MPATEEMVSIVARVNQAPTSTASATTSVDFVSQEPSSRSPIQSTVTSALMDTLLMKDMNSVILVAPVLPMPSSYKTA
jgi:hypothetical protein